jgi:raffinose/stachyose/melibiose transport system permease protein
MIICMRGVAVATRTTAAACQSRAGAAPGRSGWARHASPPWWFVLPAMVLYGFVVLVPSGRGLVFAFTNWNGLSPRWAFTGLANFRQLLHDPAAQGAIKHTLLIAIAVTIIQNAVGLLLALGVRSHIKSRGLLRVLLFAPAVTTPVVTAALWKYILAPDGALNSLLQAIGLSSAQQGWLGSQTLALWCVVGVVVWQFAGYSMVIFLAGMQNIPPEIDEAAAVDGAGPVRRFWQITLPLLRPAVTINLMLSIIGGLKLFDQVWVMTAGGPGNATETLSTLIYKNAFQFGEFSYSIALAIVLAIFVAVISGGQYRLLGRGEAAR